MSSIVLFVGQLKVKTDLLKFMKEVEICHDFTVKSKTVVNILEWHFAVFI